MGSSLNPDDIKEGDGVYFECNIRANPKPYKMTWYHDVSTLAQNKHTVQRLWLFCTETTIFFVFILLVNPFRILKCPQTHTIKCADALVFSETIVSWISHENAWIGWIEQWSQASQRALFCDSDPHSLSLCCVECKTPHTHHAQACKKLNRVCDISINRLHRLRCSSRRCYFTILLFLGNIKDIARWCRVADDNSAQATTPATKNKRKKERKKKRKYIYPDPTSWRIVH